MTAQERARLAEAEYHRRVAELLPAAEALEMAAEALARCSTAKARMLQRAARIPDLRLSVETELLLIDVFDDAIAELEAFRRRLRPPRNRALRSVKRTLQRPEQRRRTK